MKDMQGAMLFMLSLSAKAYSSYIIPEGGERERTAGLDLLKSQRFNKKSIFEKA